MKQEQKYQIITEVFGQEVRLPTLYSFEEAVTETLSAQAAMQRAGRTKRFDIVMAA